MEICLERSKAREKRKDAKTASVMCGDASSKKKKAAELAWVDPTITPRRGRRKGA